MRITDLTLTVFEWPDLPPVRYGHQNPRTGRSARMGLVTVETDAGEVGRSFLGSSFRPVDLDARGVVDVLRPIVLGADPLDRERLHRAMMTASRGIMLRPIGAVDVALWDLAGRCAGMPIHRLLGTYRRRVPAYASSATLESVEAYVDEALAIKAEGYVGYKIHPPLDPAAHVEVCRAVRRAVGDDWVLMLDSAMAYDYAAALRVGRAIQELGFRWFEDPLPVDDVYNYARLCADLEIPVIATEYTPGGFHGYAHWILMRATDALRGDVAIKGGITAVVKAAHLADGFHMPYELHHGGNSVNNVANLQIAAAIRNCDYFEILLPHAAHKYGLVRDLEIDGEGCVTVPEGPGLGAEIDLDLIRRRTLEVIR